MKQRQITQHAVVGPPRDFAPEAENVAVQIVVREHHAFGYAGGTAGKKYCSTGFDIAAAFRSDLSDQHPVRQQQYLQKISEFFFFDTRIKLINNFWLFLMVV